MGRYIIAVILESALCEARRDAGRDGGFGSGPGAVGGWRLAVWRLNDREAALCPDTVKDGRSARCGSVQIIPAGQPKGSMLAAVSRLPGTSHARIAMADCHHTIHRPRWRHLLSLRCVYYWKAASPYVVHLSTPDLARHARQKILDTCSIPAFVSRATMAV